MASRELTTRQLVGHKFLAKATQAEATLIAADANFFIDLTYLSLNASGGANTVTLRDTTGGSAVMTIAVPNAGTYVIDPGVNGGLFKQTSSNANWTVELSAATNVNIFATYQRNTATS